MKKEKSTKNIKKTIITLGITIALIIFLMWMFLSGFIAEQLSSKILETINNNIK